ncbi:MAG: FKBP-type peptidyl-prolyl cis-trans isomerase [Cytophagales bacterium]|nr:FKBP-type peptidyl-prolyl cis-trans isomerase [Cytophagales bacterium]
MRGFFSALALVMVGSVLFTSCLNSEQPNNDFEEQLIKDTTAIGLYVRSNGIPALKDASGVYFLITEAGSGFPPKNTSEVRFNYKVSILGSTTPVQQSTSPLIINIQQLIPGMKVGLSLMTPGSKAKVFIPSSYAYGETGSQGIPPNSNLEFEVELISVTKPPSEANQLKADTLALDQYIETNDIENVIKDSTGLRYVITQEATGPTATLYDKVKINYTGKVLATGTTFFTGSNGPTTTFDSRVINYIYALQAGLTKMKAGTKATFYVPSVLGFGNQEVRGAGGVLVPANSNLLYEIELVEIVD